MLFPKTVLSTLALAALSTACAARSSAQLASDASGSEDVASTESDVESLGTSFVGSDGQSVVTQPVAAVIGRGEACALQHRAPGAIEHYDALVKKVTQPAWCGCRW